jgi:Aldo/keto reductase family
MMFGDWGNKDQDESIRIIHRALDAGINFIDTADVYSAGEPEVIVGNALAGGKRDYVVLATKVHFPMGDDPERARQLTPLDHHRGRELNPASADRLDRSLLEPSPRPEHRHRRDPQRVEQPLPPGKDPLLRALDRPRLGDRRGPMDG